jgi:RNA polymerase sigma-70 factor (ECF subfamily)
LTPIQQARAARLQKLMAAAHGGDGAAYAAFLRELSPLLRGFYRRRLFNLSDDIEDLVQETLLAVHNKRHTYDPAQPVTAWLHAIARYKLVDLLRARSAREALHDPLDESHEALFADPAPDAEEARRDLGVLLQQLPDKQRLPIEYVKLQGLSVREAAQRTGLSESAVKIGVFRGLRVLAERIRGER